LLSAVAGRKCVTIDDTLSRVARPEKLGRAFVICRDFTRQHRDGIARQQEAKIWELRAAVSLARLRGNQARAGAHDLLTPAYGWFTKGFGTPTLRRQTGAAGRN
jgi:hypothetical protein